MINMQSECARIVANEVHLCVSGLVSTLLRSHSEDLDKGDLRTLCEQASELSAPIPDYEEAAREAGWAWDADGGEAGEYRLNDGGDGFEALWQGKPNRWADLCASFDIEPHDREVYEHWAVSDWLADKLEAHGEKVDRDFSGWNVWARTTTGQSISADSVIERIVAELHA